MPNNIFFIYRTLPLLDDCNCNASAEARLVILISITFGPIETPIKLPGDCLPPDVLAALELLICK